MLHVILHFRRNTPPASGRANEELHEGQQGALPLLLVAVDPVVHDLLEGRLPVPDNKVQAGLILRLDFRIDMSPALKTKINRTMISGKADDFYLACGDALLREIHPRLQQCVRRVERPSRPRSYRADVLDHVLAHGRAQECRVRRIISV